MAKKPKTEVTKSFETGMLSFARTFQIGEAYFFGSNSKIEGARIPVVVYEKGVRGQTSDDSSKDKAGKSNLQNVDTAIVPLGCDTAEIEFSIRIIPLSLKPHSCGNVAVGDEYETLVSQYAQKGGFEVLASLYAWNIANARFAWRNLFQTDESRVHVTFDNRTVIFDPSVLDMETPATREELYAAVAEGSQADVDALIDTIVTGMKSRAKTIYVTWKAAMNPGQELFPSQEFIREEKVTKGLSRVYAKWPTSPFEGERVMQASMHSQKIGAALRHIDIWHGDDRFGAISVNPYGGVQETSDVLRDPASKKSLFAVRKDADGVVAALDAAGNSDEIPGDIHFMIANLVRGGVFGSAKAKGTE